MSEKAMITNDEPMQFEVVELDEQALDDVAGGVFAGETINNCTITNGSQCYCGTNSAQP